MSLAAGTRLGAYEILVHIGAGGMGEVYRARDTRLDRTVAIKVLPAEHAQDPDLRARFEREARAIAALNHPHICTLHDVGREGDRDFLVMEHLEGETVAQRLDRGALPFDEALEYAIEIADALDRAHRAGIVHRDLKPGNIFITRSGTKLLDFGLAKLGGPTGAAVSLSNLPTTPPTLTAQGTILGTFHYMAPEQLEGADADARTDLFAFGAVLYEMLTGRKAFQGASHAALISSILSSTPAPVSASQPLSSPALDHLISRCLAKDRDERWQTAADVMRELRWLRTMDRADTKPAAAKRRWPMVAGLLLAAACVAGMAAAIFVLARPGDTGRLVRISIDIGPTTLSRLDVAIAPDGSQIAYLGGAAGQNHVFVRPLDRLSPVPVTGTGTLAEPVFSPDGRSVAFFDGSTLKTVSVEGGPVTTICRVEGNPRGAAWIGDTIVFADAGTRGLKRVSAEGGQPVDLTHPGSTQDEGHRLPQPLPGDRALLFTLWPASGRMEDAQVAALDLETGTTTVLLRAASDARFVAPGYLVYGLSGTLRAVRFDLDQLKVTGPPVNLVPEVETGPTGAVSFDVARDGTLLYVTASRNSPRTLVWVDRQGREEPILAPPRPYLTPRISPDGTRVALDVRDQDNDIWIWDVARETLMRLTADPATDNNPAWTPDGRVLFSSRRGSAGRTSIFIQSPNQTAPAVQVTDGGTQVGNPSAVSPDGTRLVVNNLTAGDLMLLDLNERRAATPLVQTPGFDRNGVISRDGRWLAYESTESGQSQVYVRPFLQTAGGQWQVSTDGGTRPLWSPRGDELFYVAPSGALMGVPVRPGETWRAPVATTAIEGNYFTAPGAQPERHYDISPDGHRFLMLKPLPGSEPKAVLVLNWLDELQRLVPFRGE